MAIDFDGLKQWVDYANREGSVILYDAAYEAYITQAVSYTHLAGGGEARFHPAHPGRTDGPEPRHGARGEGHLEGARCAADRH